MSVDKPLTPQFTRFINHSCEPNVVITQAYVKVRGDSRSRADLDRTSTPSGHCKYRDHSKSPSSNPPPALL